MIDLLDSLRQDIRYAFRQVGRSPGFAFVAIASLAVGIGVNVTIFSAANALLVRPVDAVRAEELVRIHRGAHSPLPRDWFLHLARNSRTLAAGIAEDPLGIGLEYDGSRERVLASVVSENFFVDLGVAPAVGSVFRGAPREAIGQVAVLSHSYWTSRFGADPAIVGRTIRVNGQPYEVVGVARAGFHSSQFGWGPVLFVPFSELPRLRGQAEGSAVTTSTYVTGRLAPGASADQVLAEIRSLAPAFPRGDSLLSRPNAFSVLPARGIAAEVRGPATIASTFLLAVTTLVLLIACANLGNLLLARGMGRQREFAIRTALGIGRARLVRQLLTESAVIAVAGGVAGLAVATWVSRLIASLVPLGFAFDIAPDRTVTLYATLLSMATVVLFGLAPAIRVSGIDVQQMLRTTGAGAGRRSRLRSVFLGGQVSLAMLLLVVSALFLRGLEAARTIDPGFDSERVVDLTIDLSTLMYDATRGGAFYDQAIDRVRAIGGVEQAALIATPPLSGSNSGTSVLPASAPPTDRELSRGTTFTRVSDGYFEVARIPIREGRPILASDREGTPAVAVVNESFARRFWPDGGAVGSRFRLFGEEELTTVVGLVPDTKYKSLSDRDEPFMYLALAQSHSATASMQVRLREDTPAGREALRAAVQSIDPALPLAAARSAEDVMAISLLPARIGAGLLGFFGVLALLLAAMGVYGVTSYVVGQRTVEVGVRVALGAPAGGVLRLLMSDTLRVVSVGVVLGIAGGIGIGSLASSQLYGVGALDPTALLGASGVLVLMAMLGTWLPARRVLRSDPMAALRAE